MILEKSTIRRRGIYLLPTCLLRGLYSLVFMRLPQQWVVATKLQPWLFL